MDLFSRKTIKELLKKQQIRPSRGLGQHFLISKNALGKFLQAGQFNSEEVVLEIGPGLGVLTKEIASQVKKVVAVEKDLRMCAILKETLAGLSNVRIIQEDILKLNPIPYTLKAYKVVGNLPFYLTAPVIRKFLESERQPREMVFLIQKEVAQRIVARPPKMSILAVSVQVYATAEIISYIKKTAFWPQPKVDAAIIKISPLAKLSLAPRRDLFFKIVKAGFSHPRKQLINNLSNLELNSVKLDRNKVRSWLEKNNIQPEQRAETLSVQDWLNLTKTLNPVRNF